MKSKRKILLAAFATLAVIVAALGVLLERQGRQPEFLSDHERRMEFRVLHEPWEALVLRDEFTEVIDEASKELLPNPAWTQGTSYDGSRSYFSNADDGREIWVIPVASFLSVEVQSSPYLEISEQDLAFLEERNNWEHVIVLIRGAKPSEMVRFRLRKLGILPDRMP